MNSDISTYTLSHNSGALAKFSRKAWKFQRTIRTPLTNLEPFVAEIISALMPIEKGIIAIDGYVFEPKNLRKLLSAYPQSSILLTTGLSNRLPLRALGNSFLRPFKTGSISHLSQHHNRLSFMQIMTNTLRFMR